MAVFNSDIADTYWGWFLGQTQTDVEEYLGGKCFMQQEQKPRKDGGLK